MKNYKTINVLIVSIATVLVAAILVFAAVTANRNADHTREVKHQANISGCVTIEDTEARIACIVAATDK